MTHRVTHYGRYLKEYIPVLSTKPLSPSLVVLKHLYEHGPSNRDNLYLQVKEEASLRSKRHLKLLLKGLVKGGRVRPRPVATSDTSDATSQQSNRGRGKKKNLAADLKPNFEYHPLPWKPPQRVLARLEQMERDGTVAKPE